MDNVNTKIVDNKIAHQLYFLYFDFLLNLYQNDIFYADFGTRNRILFKSNAWRLPIFSSSI